jgi:hypothetical protein
MLHVLGGMSMAPVLERPVGRPLFGETIEAAPLHNVSF